MSEEEGLREEEEFVETYGSTAELEAALPTAASDMADVEGEDTDVDEGAVPDEAVAQDDCALRGAHDAIEEPLSEASLPINHTSIEEVEEAASSFGEKDVQDEATTSVKETSAKSQVLSAYTVDQIIAVNDGVCSPNPSAHAATPAREDTSTLDGQMQSRAGDAGVPLADVVNNEKSECSVVSESEEGEIGLDTAWGGRRAAEGAAAIAHSASATHSVDLGRLEWTPARASEARRNDACPDGEYEGQELGFELLSGTAQEYLMAVEGRQRLCRNELSSSHSLPNMIAAGRAASAASVLRRGPPGARGLDTTPSPPSSQSEPARSEVLASSLSLNEDSPSLERNTNPSHDNCMSTMSNASAGLTQSSSMPVMLPPRKSSRREFNAPQVLSTKHSAPAFSFGSGKARLNLKTTGPRNFNILMPSAACRNDETPGFKYNPVLRKSDKAPRFGTEDQRPPPRTAVKISPVTGKSSEPGPGTYTLPSSMGCQALAGRKSSMPQTMAGLVNGKRGETVVAATHAMYAIPSNSTSRGRRLAAAYSFGSAVRPASSGILQSVPGPGTYNIFSAIGKTQPSSQMRSQPTTSFGKPPLRGTSRGLPTHSESPGPVYSMKNAVACGQQHLSPSRSLPNYAFSKSKRFRDPSTSAVRDGPGPGEYCV